MKNLRYHFPTCYAYSVKEPIGELNLKRALDEDTGVFSSFFHLLLHWVRHPSSVILGVFIFFFILIFCECMHISSSCDLTMHVTLILDQLRCLHNSPYYLFAESDYLVDTGDINSRIFTVNFTSLKAQSSDYVISIVKDETFERDEVFGLKINDWRLLGGAGSSVRIPPNTINQRAQVIINDENCK